MNPNRILRAAEIFYSLATAEKLPEDTKNIKVVLKNIEQLETYSARTKYTERNLKHLSSGSSRIVYLTSSKAVIKLAKNDRGIAQNEAEVKAAKCGSKFVNKVTASAKNNAWIEVPFLDDITEVEFEEMTDINFKDFGEALDYGIKHGGKPIADGPDNFDKVSKADIYKDVVRVAKKMDLVVGDLSRISSWRTNGKIPVLADPGLTREAYDELYRSVARKPRLLGRG